MIKNLLIHLCILLVLLVPSYLSPSFINFDIATDTHLVDTRTRTIYKITDITDATICITNVSLNTVPDNSNVTANPISCISEAFMFDIIQNGILKII